MLIQSQDSRYNPKRLPYLRLTVDQSLTVSCQDVGPSLAGDRSSGDLDEVTRYKSMSLYCR